MKNIDNTWGLKDEWNFYMQKKAPVVIQQDFSGKKAQWSIDVKETLKDPRGPMTLDVKETMGQAIRFCKKNNLEFSVVNLPK